MRTRLQRSTWGDAGVWLDFSHRTQSFEFQKFGVGEGLEGGAEVWVSLGGVVFSVVAEAAGK